MFPGYYRDADCVLYVSETGAVYYVSGPDVEEPAWRECDALGDDFEPAELDADELALFERSRVAHGVDAGREPVRSHAG